jgi:hypothetical protein
LTIEPTGFPSIHLRRFPGSRSLNTTIGILLFIHNEKAVESIIPRFLCNASLWVIEDILTASGLTYGSES